MTTLVIVKKKDLEKIPEGFRRYIDRYFKEQQVFGDECLVCAMYVCVPRKYRRRENRGVGPSGVELQSYTDGIKDGQRLFEWIWDAAERGLIARVDVPSPDNAIHMD